MDCNNLLYETCGIIGKRNGCGERINVGLNFLLKWGFIPESKCTQIKVTRTKFL